MKHKSCWVILFTVGLWITAATMPAAENQGLAYTNRPLQRGKAEPLLPSI